MKMFNMTYTTCDIEERANALNVELTREDTAVLLEKLGSVPSEQFNLDILDTAIMLQVGEL